MALRMVSSLRMQATWATCLGLPAATPGGLPTAEVAGVAIERCHPHQCADLTTGQLADFGDVGDDGHGGGRADPATDLSSRPSSP